jgi:hypothetical protein
MKYNQVNRRVALANFLHVCAVAYHVMKSEVAIMKLFVEVMYANNNFFSVHAAVHNDNNNEEKKLAE